jgi:hypothetical protein
VLTPLLLPTPAALADGVARSVAAESIHELLEADLGAASQVVPLSLPAELVPPGCERLAVVETTTHESGWISARLAGETPEAGSGVLAWHEGQLSGFLQGDDLRRWRVIAQADGSSRLEAVDADRMPPCAGSLREEPTTFPPMPAADGSLPTVMRAACDTNRPIDVLVLYTVDARNQAGGSAAIQGQIVSALAAANAAYQNSGISARLNLLMQMETDYVSGDFGGDLSTLGNGGDGYLDWVQPLRDTIGADMVALIRTNGEYCGIAWLMYSNGPESEGIPYSVTAWSCLATQTFAHELGHNMGCCHALGDGGGCTAGGIWPWSVGWRFNGRSGTQFRTVMAYAPGNRIDHFSNPAVSYDGTPTGVAIGQSNQADNASTINATWQTIGGFRCYRGPVQQVDCNANGRIDVLDVAYGQGSDCDGNGALDSCVLPAATPCSVPAATAFCPGGLVSSIANATPAASDAFGRGLACNAAFAAIGVPGDDDRASNAGRVELRSRVGETYAPHVTLYAPDAATNAEFGTAAVFADNQLIVSAGLAKLSGISTGRVYVFSQVDGAWTVVQTIECPVPTTGDLFGCALAYRDGTLVVGSRGNRPNGLAGAGAVFVFRRVGGEFQYETRITAPTPRTSAGFGYAVAVDGDGIVVGAPFETRDAVTERGAAYVYRRTGSTWAVEQDFTGVTYASRFGCAVAMDNDRLAIGSFGDANLAGAVFTWRRAGGWIAGADLRNGSLTNTRFGNTIAMSGNRLLVGNRLDLNASGSSVLYVDNGVEWAKQGAVYQGGTPAIAGDSAVIGDPQLDRSGNDSGGATVVLWSSDCNGDGLPDRCNVDLGSGTDRNADGILDACQPISGDLDGSGSVDAGDIGALLLLFGPCGSPCPGDLDASGEVDAGDIGSLLLLFS